MGNATLRIGILTVNDGYFVPKMILTLRKRCGERIVFVGEISEQALRKKSLSYRIRELITLMLLYGWRGSITVLKKMVQKRTLKDYLGSKTRHLQAKAPNARVVLDAIRGENVDVLINQTPHKLGRELLSLPKMGVWNRHCGRVPTYRGMYTPFWAWLYGESTMGITILEAKEDYDTGRILSEGAIDIRHMRTPGKVLKLAMSSSDELLAEAILQWEKGAIHPHPQVGNTRYFSVPSWTDLLAALLRGVGFLVKGKN